MSWWINFAIAVAMMAAACSYIASVFALGFWIDRRTGTRLVSTVVVLGLLWGPAAAIFATGQVANP